MGKRINSAAWIDSRNRWQIKVQKDGVRKTFISSTPGRNGQREANAKADAWLDENLSDDSRRVNSVYEDYLASILSSSSTSYYLQCKKYGEYYILPICGNFRICDLTEGHLQDVLDRAYKSGCLKKDRSKKKSKNALSRKTLQNILAIERSFVKWARHHKYTMLSTDDLHVPRNAKRLEKRILQPDALNILFTTDTVYRRNRLEHDPYIYAYRFMVSTGLRPGELVGLWFGDIKGDRVNLSRSVNVLRETTTGKNNNARRSFVMNEQARQAYNDQLAYMKDQGIHLNYNTPLFMIRSERSLYNYWKTYQVRNGLPGISLYELRHTFVSVNGTMSDGHLKKLIGHSKRMDSHGTYDHLLDGELEEIAEESTRLFDRVLG